MKEQASLLRISSTLIMGLLAVSMASILIRWCEAPPLAIAVYRTTIAAAVLLGAGGKRMWRKLYHLAPRQLAICSLSGLFLTLHFATWITSLSLTTVASSVVLVATSPFFVAIGARYILKTQLSWMLLMGLALAFIGMLGVAHDDFFAANDSLLGDVLALTGAVGGAGYILCGRHLRASLDTQIYVSVAYTVSALSMLLIVFIADVPLTGYPLKAYSLFALIALVPQLIGHTSFNWLLKYLSAPFVATILLGEPVIASILAFILLHEQPATLQLAGSGLILAGVVLAIWSEGRR